jgi:signal transduction histidine kinase
MKVLLRGEARTPFTYAAVFAFVGGSWLLAQPMPPSTFPHVPLLLLAAAVLASGAIGGQGPALLAACLSALIADYFFLPITGTWKFPSTLSDALGFVAFAAVAALAVWIAGTTRRGALERARADSFALKLDLENRHRQTLLELGARSLAGGSVDAICRDAATMTADALQIEHCAILELKREGGPLVVVAAAGWETGAVEGLNVEADADTQTGYALYAREPVIVNDADSDARFSVPPILRAHGVRSGVAARIAGLRRPFGVVAACSTAPRTFTAEDAQFVSGVATVLAAMFERKRVESECAELASRERANRKAADLASRRAMFLAQTATVFDTALEPEATVVSLARLAVPALAECAVVDLVHEDGFVRRVDVVDVDPSRRDMTVSIRRQAPNLRTESPFSRAIRTGQPALLTQVPERDSAGAADADHERLMKDLQCQSLLLIPLVARGQTLGLLTLASRERRYDASDLALAQELAGRAAMALDNARLYREAQAASRAKDDFLATVSHELRTPINAVLGWATMLRRHRLDEARAEYACDAIEQSARAQAQLLEQLLDVSRAIAGKLDLHLAPAHVAGIVEAAIDAVRPDADDKKVRISSRLDRSIPLLIVDPERLQQVVVNMVANAVKFSAEEGTVEVELRRAEQFVEIVVEDHGVGIKREFLPYVFDRFRQAGAKSGGVNRGLGLGMSIARDIVERHGGTITADSAGEGKGATFTVRLPMRNTSEAAVVPSRISAAG